MAVSLLERPIGHILSSTVNVATVSNSGGDALFTDSSHGLVDGDYIYILCNIEDYNGFWYVDQQSTDTFKVKRYSSASAQTFKQVVSVDYYVSETQHGWQCVHLPITYRLSNTLWPTNSADTTRTISSFTNDNGYVNLNLSGSLGTFDELAFIKISGTGDEDLDGVYQIIDKISTSDVTISLSYASTLDLLGGSVQLYYSSYNIVVEVYAGLNSGHYWASEKPYELAATLNLIPDSNNQVFFSISEILKSYVETKNNLLGGTLPNDITQFVQFYIKFGESYDFANGYSISTLESALTDDSSNFEGYAVNAKLPFKNIHSGHLTEYIMTINSASKFLTLFTIPVIFGCSDDPDQAQECYQDISFIIDDEAGRVLNLDYYSNGSLAYDSQVSIPANSEGLYRIPLEKECLYDQVKIQVQKLEEFENPSFDSGLTAWTNIPGAGEHAFTAGSYLGDNGAETTIIADGSETDFNWTTQSLRHYYYKSDNATRTINYIIRSNTRTGATGGINPHWIVADSEINVTYLKNGLEVGSQTILSNMAASTTYTGSFVTSVGDFDRIGIEIVCPYTNMGGSFAGTWQLYILLIDPDLVTTTYSEEKTFDIDCGCSNQEIRLTWLNYLGGFEYWNFTAEKEYQVDITDTGETTQNIFPEWPRSYGETASTIRKQTYRNSQNKILVMSQNLTLDQLNAISYIRTSPLVQIINSRTDVRTVIVDNESFRKYNEGDKLYAIEFTITYTDQIPSQTV